MTLSLAQHAIAHLIDLAERGEIDPWNVQVIEVVDRYLSALGSLEAQAARDVGLSQSGQAFLYASMLILLKADSLVRLETLEAAVELDDSLGEFPAVGDPVQNPLPPFLERQIRRRATAQPLQRRAVTLKELIEQLQRVASCLEKDQPRRVRLRRPRPQSKSQAARAIAQLAHHENLSEIAQDIEQLLLQNVSTADEGWIDFEQLLDWQHQSDRVGTFWGLLYLCAQSKVELRQTEFYQAIKIRPLLPTTAATADGSPASSQFEVEALP